MLQQAREWYSPDELAEWEKVPFWGLPEILTGGDYQSFSRKGPRLPGAQEEGDHGLTLGLLRSSVKNCESSGGWGRAPSP